MIQKFFPLFMILCVSLLPISLTAQKTSVYNQPEADYKMALELFNKEKFGAAQKIFSDLLKNLEGENTEIKTNAEYYMALSAIELFHPDAEYYLTKFIYTYPTHARQSMASFQMGNLQYRKRDYEQALVWYRKVDMFDLSSEQRDEFIFKNGYAHFMNEDLERAKQYFFEIKNPNSLYFAPANYYYGHISYGEGNYETALIYFRRLENDSNFGPIVPYYITHIFFLQGKYDELLAYAPDLMENSSTRRAAEIARLVGEAHFSRGEYAEALPFLMEYQSQTRGRIPREDSYQIAFAYFRAQDFESAIRYFEQITSPADSLTQSALHHLADSYLQTGQKASARNAFQQAQSMDFIPSISQEALFNYAKLSFELSMNPFNEAILSFQRYIQLYPESERREEAESHLIDLYLTTRNYRAALESMEAIPLHTPSLRSAYQRVSYFRGIELFNNGDFEGSKKHFQNAMDYPENRTIRAQAMFWMGEAYYRTENYEEAIDILSQFRLTRMAFSLDEFNLANYTAAYAHFKLERYPEAITAFRRFTSERDIRENLRNDSYLRIADSYFITKDYVAAIDFYDRAIALQQNNVDYAIYQKAVAFGVTGRFEAKIETLKNLINNYPRTSYADHARYEIANSYIVLDNSNQALIYFQQVIKNHPNSGHVRSAMLKSGLIYYNRNEDERALQSFRSVIDKYPGTAEAQEALSSMRNIYVAMDKVDDFISFSESLGFGNISTAQQDSLLYIAAENRYMQGDCENASKSFATYIERYPNGIFALNANFYKAECDFRLDDKQRALRGYEFVLDRPKSRFSENAASRAAQIHFNLNQHLAAFQHYQKLEELAESTTNRQEALVGQMRSLYRLERTEQSIEAANRVLEANIDNQNIIQEANLIIAKAAFDKGQWDKAKDFFTTTQRLSENQRAAEAKYYLALIEFRQGNYQKCEELIFKYINELASYDYWLAKTFILLADNYLSLDNTFQAKHTLRSVIDNYEGDDLRHQAIEKLHLIEQQENLQEQEASPDTLEIDFSEKSTPTDVQIF